MAGALKTTIWQAMSHNGASSSQVITGVMTITMIAVRFVLRSMLRSRCQLSISGPKDRCSRNQRCREVDERANANAAISKNGVAGNNGNTRPTAPVASAVRPTSSHKNLNRLFTMAVQHRGASAGKPTRRVRIAHDA